MLPARSFTGLQFPKVGYLLDLKWVTGHDCWRVREGNSWVNSAVCCDLGPSNLEHALLLHSPLLHLVHICWQPRGTTDVMRSKMVRARGLGNGSRYKCVGLRITKWELIFFVLLAKYATAIRLPQTLYLFGLIF